MRLLLDAQILIWHGEADGRLSEKVSCVIEEASNELFVGAGTWWELTLKESLGKLEIEGGVEGLYRDWILSRAASVLPVEWPHLRELTKLSWLHRDPFDRLFVAQALGENLVAVTADPQVQAYPGLRLLDL